MRCLVDGARFGEVHISVWAVLALLHAPEVVDTPLWHVLPCIIGLLCLSLQHTQ